MKNQGWLSALRGLLSWPRPHRDTPPTRADIWQAMGLGKGMGRGMGRIFSPYHESWRKHPMINPRYRDLFPGFSYAVIIIIVILIFSGTPLGVHLS